MTSLFRRLDDATCAFLTGHSRRDLDRVRRRRLYLLGRRLVASQQKDAEWAQKWDEKLYLQSSADASSDLLEQFEQSSGRRGGAALLYEIEIYRAWLGPRRIWTQVRALDGSLEYVLQPLHTRSIVPNKLYGKLFDGLREEGVGYTFMNKLRLSVSRWHSVLTPFLRLRSLFSRHERLSGPP